MNVGLDISVDDSHITETACPDGVTTIVEKTERWRASGSGDLKGSAGIVQITHERITATYRRTGDDLDLLERDVDLLRDRDRGLRAVAKRKGARLVIPLRRFSPRNETLRPRIPKRGHHRRLGLPDRTRRDEQPPDAAGCVPTKIHAKTVHGSLEHFTRG
jgi:hypothetical protein